MLWQKTYGEVALVNQLTDAVILKDGGIVISGSYSKLTSLPLLNMEQNGIILKVDRGGYFQWMNEFNNYGPGNYWETFYGIDKTKENGFILSGNVMNLPKAKAWAVKTDSLGCVLPGCISTTLSVDSILITPEPIDTLTVGTVKNMLNKTTTLIYPNPMEEILQVECNELSGIAEVSFVNMVGVKVGKAILTQRKTRIDVSYLNKGFYFVCLVVDGERILTMKLFKE